MRRRWLLGIGCGTWALAGWMLVAAPEPVTAQDATPTAIEVGGRSTTEAQPAAAGGGNAPRAVPATGVGSSSADIASGWLAIGASVGAIVAGAAALRDRFGGR